MTSARLDCIDLAGRCGDRFRIAYEPQASEWPPADRMWLARIACRGGGIGVHGGERLFAFTTRRRLGTLLRALPFVERAQGDAEVRVVFPVEHLDLVLTILRPYRRRQGLSAAQRAALAAGRRPFRARTVDTGAFPAPGSPQTATAKGTGAP